MMHSTLIDQDTITRYLISCDMRIVLAPCCDAQHLDRPGHYHKVSHGCDMRIVLGTML